MHDRLSLFKTSFLWAALAVALIMSVHLSWVFAGSRCCDTCFAVSLLCCVRFSVSYKSLQLRRSELLTLFEYFHLKATAASTSLRFEFVCIPLYDFKSYTVILRSSFKKTYSTRFRYGDFPWGHVLLFGIIFNGDYHVTTMWHSFCLKNVLVGLRLLDFWSLRIVNMRKNKCHLNNYWLNKSAALQFRSSPLNI